MPSVDFWKEKLDKIIITDDALYRLSELILDSSQNSNKEINEIECPVDGIDYILDLFEYLGSLLDTKLKSRLEKKFFRETEVDKQELLSNAIQVIEKNC